MLVARMSLARIYVRGIVGYLASAVMKSLVVHV